MSYWRDTEKELQAKELSARLNGVKVVYVLGKKINKKAKRSIDKWNEEAKQQRLKLIKKYGKSK